MQFSLVIVFVLVGSSVVYKAVYDQTLQQRYSNYVAPVLEQRRLLALFGESTGLRKVITDRFGKTLAVDVESYDLSVDPQKFKIEDNSFSKALALLNLNCSEILEKLERYKMAGKKFMYLDRSVDFNTAKAVHSLNVYGVDIREIQRRDYPLGESAAHLVGLLNVERKGVEGLELRFDEFLSNKNDIPVLETTIDYRVQTGLHKELTRVATENDVKLGAALVLDTKNGEVMALANYPSFDPNNRKTLTIEHLFNRVISYQIEPGMLISPFTLMGALNDSDFRNEVKEIDTSPGYINIGHHKIQDSENHGFLSLDNMLAKRSRVGLSKVALSIPSRTLWQLYDDVGFGATTGVQLPGESAGYLPLWNDWSDIQKAAISYGYGVATTPIQVAQAYLSIANSGKSNPVTLVRDSENLHYNALTTPKIAEGIRYSLEREPVELSSNSGKKIIRTAGMGDLVQKADLAGYEKRYTGLFVGMAPIESPRYLVMVMLDEASKEKQALLSVMAENLFRELAPELERISRDWEN